MIDPAMARRPAVARPMHRCDDIRNTFGAASTEYRQCLASSGSSSGSLRTGGGSYGGWGSAGGGGHK